MPRKGFGSLLLHSLLLALSVQAAATPDRTFLDDRITVSSKELACVPKEVAWDYSVMRAKEFAAWTMAITGVELSDAGIEQAAKKAYESLRKCWDGK